MLTKSIETFQKLPKMFSQFTLIKLSMCSKNKSIMFGY